MNQLGKFALLGALFASGGACEQEDIPSKPCEASASKDASVDSAKISPDTSLHPIDAKSSEIPEATLRIMKHVAGCYAILRDSAAWCENNINYREAKDPKFCDIAFANEPKYLQDVCQKKALECVTGGYGKKFYACLDTIPAEPKCKAVLHPLSQASDADSDGLTDHYELWHSNTNPCEPCSFGDSTPCDAEADNDHDGVNNKDSQKFNGGCISHIATDECG